MDLSLIHISKALFANEYLTSCFIKNVVKASHVEIGEYTYYDDEDAIHYEKNNILFNYPEFGDHLIIGKFCSIASGTQFIMGSACLLYTSTDDFMKYNATQIAEKCYVSISTIYRLCHKLGITGLSDLKLQVSASIEDYLKESEDFDYNYPIKQNETQFF